MSQPQNLDALFRDAVAAIDAGDVRAIESLLASHPALISNRLDAPGQWLRDKVGNATEPGEFFERPYLLWFIAEDPVRCGRLPANIADIALTIISAIRQYAPATLQEQLDYALTLFSFSWIARDCGVQVELIDVLIDAGASPDGNPDNALVNGNISAAEHLIKRGAPLTLATALSLKRWDDCPRLFERATDRQKRFARVLAALRGPPESPRWLIKSGIGANPPSEDLYSHATPLHHAVCSGSLDAVQALVEAGADLTAKDSAWEATPLQWAEYQRSNCTDKDQMNDFAAIKAYLNERSSRA